MNNKKHLKSAMCVIMSLVMLFAAIMSVAAIETDITQTSASGTVYYENTTNWSTVYCYMWNGGGEQKNAEWPGIQMTSVSGNVWKYTTTADYQNVIFNNGSGGTGNQTSDLNFPGSGQIYNGSSWSAYDDPTPTNPTPTNPTPTKPTPTNPPVTDGNYVYCKNAASWGDVYCYMWKDGSGNNGEWPGKKMENIGENVWRYEVSGSFNMIIFNSGSDANKTGDMSYPGANYIYDNASNKWEPYDTSPITVRSFAIDATDTVYKNMEVNVSANATSTGGTVYYKFSVTNGGSTKTLQDFSTANSVKWTPTAAGTYTLTCDFKDASGNENQRTVTVTVADDSSVKEPIIKKVTPGTQQVKNNTNMNIAVTAGGGKTGTNLLFYKYTVKDANGKTLNVPYYTKNATYVYKPTSLGKFTVTVSVQNSDNTTVERTYTFESVTNPTVPTEPSTPTTPVDPSGVIGDADGDGAISILDATLIQMFKASLPAGNKINLALADYDGDGQVSVLDATAIQLWLAKV